jgi:uncharacterized membrane protein
MDSRRAESFSDGVFAVAITVLVFNLLPISQSTARLTGSELGHHWPSYLAYVVSFLTIGIMWLNHHTMLSQITKVDRPTLVLNLFLLMGIVAIPFPTALVAAHLVGADAGQDQATIATVTYGLVMIAIALAYAATWIYISTHQQALGARRRIATPRLATFRFTVGNFGYIGGTLIALIYPVGALIIFGLLAVYYLFDHLPDPGEGDDDDVRSDAAGPP